MAFRFLLLWIFVSAIVGAWMFWMTKPDKSVAKGFIKKGVISGVVGGVVVAGLFLINQIQGV